MSTPVLERGGLTCVALHLSVCLVSRHGYEAQSHEAEAKPKLLLNHEAEAEAKALTFRKHEAEAEAEALTFLKYIPLTSCISLKCSGILNFWARQPY